MRETLAQLLSNTSPISYEAVRAQVRGPRMQGSVPCLQVTDPDLTDYDRLLSCGAAAAVCA